MPLISNLEPRGPWVGVVSVPAEGQGRGGLGDFVTSKYALTAPPLPRRASISALPGGVSEGMTTERSNAPSLFGYPSPSVRIPMLMGTLMPREPCSCQPVPWTRTRVPGGPEVGSMLMDSPAAQAGGGEARTPTTENRRRDARGRTNRRGDIN